MTACQDAQVKGDYRNPYTPAEVRRMMNFHGSLVAKFDGRQWWFLSGDRWLRIENAGAHEVALLLEKRGSSPI